MGAAIDWDSVFVPTLHLGEIVLRGSLVYLFLFFLLRVLRREAGHIGLSDVVVIVLVADAAQNAMAAEYHSLTEGAVLVATIAFWDYFLDWLAFKVPALRRLLRPRPVILVRNGHVQRRNLERQMIEEEALLGKLREQGVGDVREVRVAYLEADGEISVIGKSGG